jgi:hypothetical protein
MTQPAIKEPGPTTIASSIGFDHFVICRLRHARIRMQIALNHINTVGTALTAGWIDGEDALAMLGESGLLDFVTGASS